MAFAGALVAAELPAGQPARKRPAAAVRDAQQPAGEFRINFHQLSTPIWALHFCIRIHQQRFRCFFSSSLRGVIKLCAAGAGALRGWGCENNSRHTKGPQPNLVRPPKHSIRYAATQRRLNSKPTTIAVDLLPRGRNWVSRVSFVWAHVRVRRSATASRVCVYTCTYVEETREYSAARTTVDQLLAKRQRLFATMLAAMPHAMRYIVAAKCVIAHTRAVSYYYSIL